MHAGAFSVHYVYWHLTHGASTQNRSAAKYTFEYTGSAIMYIGIDSVRQYTYWHLSDVPMYILAAQLARAAVSQLIACHDIYLVRNRVSSVRHVSGVDRLLTLPRNLPVIIWVPTPLSTPL